MFLNFIMFWLDTIFYICKLKSREFLLDMKSEFETDTGNDSYLPLNDVLGRISYLLECHGITYSRYGDGKKGTMCKLSEPIIKDYFDTKRSNKDSAKVKLDRFKNELLDQE